MASVMSKLPKTRSGMDGQKGRKEKQERRETKMGDSIRDRVWEKDFAVLQ